ncbi:MAG: HAMP domain-containing histidine kinase [Coriobacteriia bacterium]|nr:HAMP domain-containing histidine kinase [Coriobacteriia bacterium]
MFKKLRNKILISNMIVLSLLTIVAMGLTYAMTERMVHADNLQRLAEEAASQSHSLNVISAFLNTEGWSYTGNAGSRTFVCEETGEVTVTTGEEMFLFIFVGDDPDLIPIVSGTDYRLYPMDAYLEAQRLKPPHTAYSRYIDYYRVAAGDRIWLARETPFIVSDIDDNSRFTPDVALATVPVPIKIPDGLTELTQKQIEQLTDPRLAMVDITESLASLAQLRLILIASGIALTVLFFFTCLFLANRAVRPAEESWMRQRQFMSDASHELKTPLSIIRASKEVLHSNQGQTVESQAKWLNSIETETHRMSKLVDTLLTLSQGDETPAQLEKLDISSLVDEVRTMFEAPFYEKGLVLHSDITPELLALGEPDALKSAFVALFENALGYTPEGQEVSISLTKEHKHIKFVICNTGVCLLDEDLMRLFDRFYRVDQARSSGPGGYGLGLSIAQAAVLRSGGKLEAASDDNSVTFVIHLKPA